MSYLALSVDNNFATSGTEGIQNCVKTFICFLAIVLLLSLFIVNKEYKIRNEELNNLLHHFNTF